RVHCISDETIVKQRIMIHNHIDYEDYAKLPEFTWEEINECVQRGAHLVVCDRLVVDFLDWIHSHPDFYNTHLDMKISEEIDSQEALLIPNDKLSEKFSSVLAKHISHLQGVSIPQKLSTISRSIDNLNKMYYLKTP
ncbi:12158_t:CDS:2, partial [Racocetra persica]